MFKSTSCFSFLKAASAIFVTLISALAISANAATVLRINVGGGSYTDSAGHTWSRDYGFKNGYTTANNSADIKNTTLDVIYRSQRRHNVAQKELNYVLPVAKGSYSVTLHFAELQSTAFASGKRVFDVYTEGRKSLSGIDVFRQSGGPNSAMSRTIANVNVSDGNLNLLLRGTQSAAMLSAIEVIPVDSGSTADTGSDSTSTDSTSGGTSANTGSTTDTAGNTGSLANSVSAVVRINVGGGRFTDKSGQVWSSDYGFKGGYTTANNRTQIYNTDLDVLYRSQRRHNVAQKELNYAIPVANGSYSVRLHFAELQASSFATGKRVFEAYVEGSRRLTGIDVFKQSGGANTAMSRTVTGVSVKDGNLNLSLRGTQSAAMLSAIEVIAQDGTAAGGSGSGGSTGSGSTGGGAVSANLKITTHPANELATPGSTITLKVGASGTGTIAYQWYFNGSKIAGATGSTLRFASIKDADAGNYYCIASIGSESVTSNTAKLVVSGVDPVATSKSVNITWAAPTKRVDGTVLKASDIASYEIYHGAGSTSNMTLVETVDGSTNSSHVDGLGLGVHYFTIRTVDKSGARSNQSTMVNITN